MLGFCVCNMWGAQKYGAPLAGLALLYFILFSLWTLATEMSVQCTPHLTIQYNPWCVQGPLNIGCNIQDEFFKELLN